MSDRDIRQLAQMLIFEFSQLAVARGGQAIFTEIGLYWEVPEHMESMPAIGPGGQPTGRTYGAYVKESQRFARTIFEIYREGDAAGRPFFFPKPLVHISERFFETGGHGDFLRLVCETAAAKGNPLFLFDRNDSMKVPGCFRANPKSDRETLRDIREPWKMRYATVQNVSLNLPRLGYRAGGEDARLFSLLSESMEMAAKAHLQKKNFIEGLLSRGDEGPLSILAMSRDGSPFLRMNRAAYLVGLVGLNELVQISKGVELHESAEARKFGLKLLRHMKVAAGKLGRTQGMKLVLEQTPAESTAYRFARLDLKYFSPASGHIVKGDISRGEIYYNNSTFFNIAAPMKPLDRVKLEGRFHPLIDGHAMTCLWLDDGGPSGRTLAAFVEKVFRETESDALSLSPHLSFCPPCGQTFRGFHETCPRCGSGGCEGITRITGYFTKASRLNRGKTAELRDIRKNPSRFD